MSAVVERFLVLLILFTGNAVLASNYAIIKNPHSGLVLEPDTDGIVRIQKYTGSDLQLWLVLCAKTGYVEFTNKATRKVLDVRDHTSTTVVYGSPVITSNKTESLCQKWVVESKGMIGNACKGAVLDIRNNKYVPGQQVDAYLRFGYNNQIFELEFET